MNNNTKILIERVSNGYLLTMEADEEDRRLIFSTRRQVMLYIGSQLKAMEGAGDEEE